MSLFLSVFCLLYVFAFSLLSDTGHYSAGWRLHGNLITAICSCDRPASIADAALWRLTTHQSCFFFRILVFLQTERLTALMLLMHDDAAADLLQTWTVTNAVNSWQHDDGPDCFESFIKCCTFSACTVDLNRPTHHHVLTFKYLVDVLNSVFSPLNNLSHPLHKRVINPITFYISFIEPEYGFHALWRRRR